jgi:hypothetical protein
MLSLSDAVAIYKMKISLQNPKGLDSAVVDPQSLWGKTRPVAKLFGTSLRTVKYIWNRQTWSHATMHLWPMEANFRLMGFEHKVNALLIFFSDLSMLR